MVIANTISSRMVIVYVMIIIIILFFNFFSPSSFADRISSRRGGWGGRKERNEMKFHSFVHSSFFYIYYFNFRKRKERGGERRIKYFLSLSLSMQHRDLNRMFIREFILFLKRQC